jgi:hypothetical protein
MTTSDEIWLGLGKTGDKVGLRTDQMNCVILLGPGAKSLVGNFAYSCFEAGLNTLVLDTDGMVSEQVSGYFPAYDHSFFLYDVLRIENDGGLHGELGASAYTAALNLSFEQEAILKAALQRIASEQGVMSPSSLYDKIGVIEGFRGHSVDQLKGRLSSLQSLNVVGQTDVFGELLEDSAIANFAKALSPELAELTCALFIAKLLVMLRREEMSRPDALILSEAHRIFKSHSVINHSERLLTVLLSEQLSKVFASDLPQVLAKTIIEACPVKISSSDLWNHRSKEEILTPNFFMLESSSYGYKQAFVPRYFEEKKSEPKTGAFNEPVNDELTKQILEQVRTNQTATRKSLAAYFSVDFPSELVDKAIDRLLVEGHLARSPKDVRADLPIDALVLTATGWELLKRLKGGSGE